MTNYDAETSTSEKTSKVKKTTRGARQLE